MKKTIQVPFDMGGNQITWDGYRCELRDNYEFSAKLVYSGFERGRSALNVVWKDLDKNILYRSGMSMLDDLLTNSLTGAKYFINDGGLLQTEGCFTFRKQGTSVLLTPIKAAASSQTNN